MHGGRAYTEIVTRTFLLASLALFLAASAQAAAPKGGSFGGKATGGSAGGTTTGGAALPKRKPDPKLFNFASHKELPGGKPAPVSSGGGTNGSGPSNGTDGNGNGVPTGFGRPLKAKRPSLLKPLPQH